MGYWEDVIAEANARTSAKNTEGEPPDNEISAGFQQEYSPPVPVQSRTIVGPGGQVDLNTNPIFTYISGDGQRYWDSYAPETQQRLLGQMTDIGIVPTGTTTRDRYALGSAWEFVMGAANDWEVTPFTALSRLGPELKKMSGGGGGGGGGAAGPRVEIPDYPTIAQNVKNMLRSTLGRDPQDWEIALTGAEMQGQYQNWAQTKMSSALSGGGIYEINDPTTLTQAFVEDTYASELDRLGDIEDERVNYSLAMQSLTKGAGMVS